MTRPAAFARTALVGLTLAFFGSSGCAVLEPRVVRSVDGVASEGRYIDAEAYALYAVAALSEARGQWSQALDLYRRALAVDGRGPEIRTRIGAVACKLRQLALADRSFAAALKSDGSYGPVWFELAQCRKSRADIVGAQGAASEALRLDPERAEVSLLAAELADLRGDHAGAWRLRDALATHAPDSLPAQRAILAAAERDHDTARATRACRALDDLRRRSASAAAPRGVPAALVALERGDVTAARQLAERLLGADPSNGDALVLALGAADLEQDDVAFARLLEQARAPGAPVSPQVLGVLESLLTRRVSAQAGQLVRPQP